MLLFADNFAGYGTGSTGNTNMGQGLYTAAGGSTIAPSTANPPANGTHSLRITSTASNALMRRTLAAGVGTIGIGERAYLSALGVDTNDLPELFCLMDNSAVKQCTMTVDPSGYLQLRTGDGDDAVAATSLSPVFTAGTYHHIETKIVISSTVGSIECRLDGVDVPFDNETNINTRSAGAATCQNVGWGKSTVGGSGVTTDITDVSVWDTSGSHNNDFLGDIVWFTLLPTSDQALSDWTRNTGASDFDCIDDTTPDDDTTYVAATAAAQVSQYGLGDLPANASTVVACITRNRVRKTDAGAAQFQAALIGTQGSPDAESNGADRSITTSYTYYDDVHETDPSTGVSWTPTGVNGALLQIEKTV